MYTFVFTSMAPTSGAEQPMQEISAALQAPGKSLLWNTGPFFCVEPRAADLPHVPTPNLIATFNQLTPIWLQCRFNLPEAEPPQQGPPSAAASAAESHISN